MRNSPCVWKHRAIVISFALALCVIPALVAVGSDACYTDVLVTGTGIDWLDRSYEYVGGSAAGRPTFQYGTYGVFPFGFISYRTGKEPGDGWSLVAVTESPTGSDLMLVYWNLSNSPLPPSHGWGLYDWAGDFGFDVHAIPAPTLSGGEPCPTRAPICLEITPLGAGEGFLTRCLDLGAGEAPPMIGCRPLQATYETGESIVGSCRILTCPGERRGATYMIVSLYAVDVTTDPEAIGLLGSRNAQYDSEDASYRFEVDTSELAAGIYDLRLGFEDGSTEWIRVEVVAPAV